MAAGSDAALSWAASKGFSVLLGPHEGRHQLGTKRRYYADELAKGGFSDKGRDIPTARLIALADNRERAAEVARRGAEWLVSQYVGPQHKAVSWNPKDYQGHNPVDFYMKEVILHGTPEDVVDQVHALEDIAQLNYLMAAPLSRETFKLLTDKVVPKLI